MTTTALDPDAANRGGTGPRVLVIGGGWAGLSAAIELARHGLAPTLLESARQLGGRARCVRFGERRVDNGQHVMLGAYHALRRVLLTVGLDEAEVLERRALDLLLLHAHARTHLRAPRLVAPWHLVAALAGARGLGPHDKLQAIRFVRVLAGKAFRIEPDCSVERLLRMHRQPRGLVRAVWEPLCIAALNAPVGRASAQIFAHVLGEAFTGDARHSDLLLPRADLGAVLPAPAFDYIETRGGRVRLGHRVRDLLLGTRGVEGVRLADGRELAAEHAVVAVPHWICARLLEPYAELRKLAGHLKKIRTEPICTVYLEYPPDVALERPMLGLVGTTTQWLFDRRLTGQPGLLAAVISANGDHMRMDNERLAAHVGAEIADRFPDWPPARRAKVIRERRATFASRVDVNARRPDVGTPVHGLWLAGEYIATGLPGTLESAVRAGLESAGALVSALDARRRS